MSAAPDPSRVIRLVIAKEPAPGRAKTRLIPDLGPDGAAAVAEAALADTLEAVAASAGERRILVLDGAPGPWLPAGFEVVPQRDGGLGARLAGAFAAAAGPAFLIGMDTPQISAELIDEACARLCEPDAGAVLGLAVDGGWWGLGLHCADERVFEGVPMSEPDTGGAQRRSLQELGLATVELRRMRDVDTLEDAMAVAEQAPGSRFATALARTGVGGGVGA